MKKYRYVVHSPFLETHTLRGVVFSDEAMQQVRNTLIGKPVVEGGSFPLAIDDILGFVTNSEPLTVELYNPLDIAKKKPSISVAAVVDGNSADEIISADIHSVDSELIEHGYFEEIDGNS